MNHRTLKLFVIVVVMLLGLVSAASAQDVILPTNMQEYVDSVIAECGGDETRTIVEQYADHQWFDVAIFCSQPIMLTGAPEGLTAENGLFSSGSFSDEAYTQSLNLFVSVEQVLELGEQAEIAMRGYAVALEVSVEDGILRFSTEIERLEAAAHFHSAQYYVLDADGNQLAVHVATDFQDVTQANMSLPLPEGAAQVVVNVYDQVMRCPCIENTPDYTFTAEMPAEEGQAVDTDGFIQMDSAEYTFSYAFDAETGMFCFVTDAQSVYVNTERSEENIHGEPRMDYFTSFSPYQPMPDAVYCGGAFEPNGEMHVDIWARNEDGSSGNHKLTIPVTQQ